MKAYYFFSVLALLASCSEDPKGPHPQVAPPPQRILNLPPQLDNYGTGINNAAATLGRVLFYDNQLSESNDVSCASCHKQAYAFGDNTPLSQGLNNQTTLRNSIAIQGVNPQSQFWDGRTHDIFQMVMMPITNEREMGVTNLNTMLNRLNAKEYYKTLCNQAYGTYTLTQPLVAFALSSFVRSITASDSKFDKNNFNGTEMAGLNLFITKYNCAGCHEVSFVNGLPNYQNVVVLADVKFANIGLDAETGTLTGLGAITNQTADNAKYRVPSLRNIEITGPYMHDGRFATLEEVIDHYSSNIKDVPNLDPLFRNYGVVKKFDISPSEKVQLIAFLKTLTSPVIVKDPKWSNPF